jgi:hypothetical protein
MVLQKTRIDEVMKIFGDIDSACQALSVTP